MEFDGFSLIFFYSFFFFLSTLLPLWLVGTKWNLLLLSEMASFLLQSALIWRHTDDTDDNDDDDADDDNYDDNDDDDDDVDDENGWWCKEYIDNVCFSDPEGVGNLMYDSLVFASFNNIFKFWLSF